MSLIVFEKIMEKQKLIQIILKDLQELNEIASELSSSNGASKFELEIAVSKSKLVYQEFEFLNELNAQDSPKKTEIPVFEEPQLPFVSEKEEKVEPQKPVEPAVAEVQKTATKSARVEVTEHEEPEYLEQHAVEADEDIQEELEEEPVEEVEEIVVEKPTQEQVENIKEEPEEEKDVKKTLGENFVKGKSLNDLLTENKNPDLKLPGSHINRLEEAIGLNDRFQYTRELFNNNPELFRNTVREIDQLKNLEDAVAYLNIKFKWKKTDTSIRFAQLVKRRFSN